MSRNLFDRSRQEEPDEEAVEFFKELKRGNLSEETMEMITVDLDRVDPDVLEAGGFTNTARAIRKNRARKLREMGETSEGTEGDRH